MNTSYIYINTIACLCVSMLFIAFFAAERSKEMNAWVLLLFDMSLWTTGSLFMRLDLYPDYTFWYYVSLLALLAIPYLIYCYVYQVANEDNLKMKLIWGIGTVIIIVIASTGFFLKPPTKIIDGMEHTAFIYKSDAKVAIPTIFGFAIIGSIIKLFKKILLEKGRKAPGVNELIIGCSLLGLGNIAQVLPGNIFPWDTLSGVVFAILITLSLYRRYMFNTSLLVSSNVLCVLSDALCILAAALLFPRMRNFCANNGGKIIAPDGAAFIIMAVLVFCAIYGFRRLLNIIFHENDSQSNRIRRYSDLISHTLSVDDILDETIKVIKSEINVKQLYICLLDDDKFVSMRGAMPLAPGNFAISNENPYVKCLQQGENHIVLKDFELSPLYKSIWNEERIIFRDNNIDSICALKDNGEVIGLVLLTEKERDKEKDNRSTYDYSDFAFLNTVCSVASMALKNASLFERVAERDHLFSGMTAFIPNVILIKKKGVPSFCFISANTEKVLGLPYDFFTKHSPTEALAVCIGQEKANKIIADFAISPESGYNFDMPFTRPDNNEEHTIRCAFSGIISEGVISHYVYVLSDISADIEARELLRSSVEMAQNSNKAKSEFLSHMSHEIRTPMNSIAGLTYLAREQLPEDDDSLLAGYLDQIDQSAHYLLNLLNNIMDMSKIECQLYQTLKEPFDVRKLLDEISAVFSTQMQVKGVNFICSTNEVKHNTLIGDQIALQKILNNLISNAYKFTPSGGEVKLFATQRYVGNKTIVMHIEVSDTGIGISKEFVSKIFEPYTQEIRANGNNTGSGLGMAICKNLVDMLGGTITATSGVGKGTKFIADIPFGLSMDSVVNEEKTTIDYSILEGKHVMVVDDVMVNTMITSKLLEKYGVIVDCATNGAEAVELFETNKEFYYDCILMDIQMPVMDGFEAAEAIRSKKRRYANTVPIIAMTADAFINDSGNNAARINFDGYVIKPVSPDALYEVLIKMLVERE